MTSEASTSTTNLEGGGTSADSKLNQNLDDVQEFARVGRTGRRNAVPDVNMDPNLHLSPNVLNDMMRNIDCGSGNDFNKN